MYVNADRFERELKQNLHFNFNAYRVKVSQTDFVEHIKSSSHYHEKIKDPQFIDHVAIKAGILKLNLSESEINSYHASFVASYLVEKLFETKQSFCFETVMSHVSKVDLLESAKYKGYKTYLYFVYTDNPELNVLRVKLRARMGLHNVNANVIRSRYKRVFELLPSALRFANKAYVINNSERFIIVAEKTNDVLILKEPVSEGLSEFIRIADH